MLTSRAPLAWAAARTLAWRAGNSSDPLVVGRVEGLVDDLGALGGGCGEGGVAGVAAEDLDVVGDRGGAGAVDQPHCLAPTAQGVQGGQADGPGPKDHLPRRGGHHASAPRVARRRVPGLVTTDSGRRIRARSTATPRAISQMAHRELPRNPARSKTGNPGTAVARMSPWLNRYRRLATSPAQPTHRGSTRLRRMMTLMVI